MKIAVFGSAFNPPTRGHLDAINYVRSTVEDVDKVLLIPSYKHAFTKDMIDYETRLKLLECFVNDISLPDVCACPIEHQIASEGRPVYTYDVLEFLAREKYPHATLCFVIGPDNQKHWHKFYKSDDIQKRWSVLVVPERVNIRSTKIRDNIKHKSPICEYVTPSVEKYILQHDLYL